MLASLNGKVADLEIARRAREDEVSRRLMTVPGIGPISATAIAAMAPPVETFAKGRDFVGATVGETGRKNQLNPLCSEHAFMIWFRPANSHTGPQLHRCIRGRTDGSIRPRANILQKLLASGGASTDGFTA
jgi:hypothetical protein